MHCSQSEEQTVSSRIPALQLSAPVSNPEFPAFLSPVFGQPCFIYNQAGRNLKNLFLLAPYLLVFTSRNKKRGCINWQEKFMTFMHAICSWTRPTRHSSLKYLKKTRPQIRLLFGVLAITSFFQLSL
jgi:hypothetical protein